MNDIIGQKRIVNWVESLNPDHFPHFVLLVGLQGSGKRSLSMYIARKLNAVYAPCSIKVDSVREVVDYAYKSESRTVFCFADADTMSVSAKNALLKITEEPPKNTYIILTVVDESTLLYTIVSRATMWRLEPYTKDELKEFAIREYGTVTPNVEYAVDLGDTPHEVRTIVKYGDDFLKYVNLVIDNIGEVESANAFKSGTKLALKGEDDKYDLGIFFKVFINECLKRIKDNPLRYAEGIVVTDKHYRKQKQLGVNQQQIYDAWVFEIREYWGNT